MFINIPGRKFRASVRTQQKLFLIHDGSLSMLDHMVEICQQRALWTVPIGQQTCLKIGISEP